MKYRRVVLRRRNVLSQRAVTSQRAVGTSRVSEQQLPTSRESEQLSTCQRAELRV